MSTLPAAVSGELHALAGPAGRIAVVAAGGGRPLLLVHSVNAAASAAEMRPLHDHFAAGRAVYSLDLPGYGLSDRADRPYTVRLMTDAVVQAARWVQARHGGEPVDTVALSLSCEFAARAHLEQPGLLGRLVLVSPTGFRGGRALRQPEGATLHMPGMERFLRGPGWGGFLFRQLTRPSVIRYFLQRTWGGKAIDETLWAYCCRTVREPGAEFAPLCFLSGQLFSADIHGVYERLGGQVLVVHGTRGDFTDYRGLGLVSGRSNWRVKVLAGGAMPYFEKPGEFFEACEGFLSRPA